MFIVANLRSRGGREILPVSGENAEIGIQVVGDIEAEGWLDLMKRVYSPDGIAPCLCGGGSVQPKILCFVDQTFHNPKITEDARCLVAKYNAGITNWGSNSAMAFSYAGRAMHPAVRFFGSGTVQKRDMKRPRWEMGFRLLFRKAVQGGAG